MSHKIIALFNIDEKKNIYDNKINYNINNKPINDAFTNNIPIIIINSQDSISGSDKHFQHYIRTIVEENFTQYILLSKTDATNKTYYSAFTTLFKKVYNVRTRIYVNLNNVYIDKKLHNNNIINLLNSYATKNNKDFSYLTKDINDKKFKIILLQCKRRRFTPNNDNGKYGGGKIGYELTYTILNNKITQKVLVYNFGDFKQIKKILDLKQPLQAKLSSKISSKLSSELSRLLIEKINIMLNLKNNILFNNNSENIKTYVCICIKNHIYISGYQLNKVDNNKNKLFIVNYKIIDIKNYPIYFEQLQYNASDNINNSNNAINVSKPIGPGNYVVAKQYNQFNIKKKLTLNIEKKKISNDKVNSLIKLYKDKQGLGILSIKNTDKKMIKQNYNNLNPLQKLLFLALYIDIAKKPFQDNIFYLKKNSDDITSVINEIYEDLLILNDIKDESSIIKINSNSNLDLNKKKLLKNVLKKYNIEYTNYNESINNGNNNNYLIFNINLIKNDIKILNDLFIFYKTLFTTLKIYNETNK